MHDLSVNIENMLRIQSRDTNDGGLAAGTIIKQSSACSKFFFARQFMTSVSTPDHVAHPEPWHKRWRPRGWHHHQAMLSLQQIIFCQAMHYLSVNINKHVAHQT